MALDETLPVDSEKPDREDIFTSENERVALSHYTTRVAGYRRSFGMRRKNVTPRYLFIEETHYSRNLNSTRSNSHRRIKQGE